MDASPSSAPMSRKNSRNMAWIKAGWDTNQLISCTRTFLSMVMLPSLSPAAKMDIRLRNAAEKAGAFFYVNRTFPN
jgi:hypothetical protein